MFTVGRALASLANVIFKHIFKLHCYLLWLFVVLSVSAALQLPFIIFCEFCAIRFVICPMNGNKCKRKYDDDENTNSSDVSLLRLIWFHWEKPHSPAPHPHNTYKTDCSFSIRLTFPIESIVFIQFLCGLWTVDTNGIAIDRSQRMQSTKNLFSENNNNNRVHNKCASFRG